MLIKNLLCFNKRARPLKYNVHNVQFTSSRQMLNTQTISTSADSSMGRFIYGQIYGQFLFLFYGQFLFLFYGQILFLFYGQFLFLFYGQFLFLFYGQILFLFYGQIDLWVD